MSSTISVKIITPAKVLTTLDANMVNIPGKKGMFGVLPNHAKLTANINIGVITLFIDDVEKRFFIYGGVAQITGSQVNIVTEFATDLEEVKKTEILENITGLKHEMKGQETDTMDWNILNNKLHKYESLIEFMK